MTTRKPIALHWKILIGLVLGIVVGLAINTLWTTSTWNSLGVDDPASWLSGTPSQSEIQSDTQTDTGAETGTAPTVNANAGFGAHAARFIGNLNGFIGDLFLRG
ncbi:MAG: hypothetical protein AB8C13_00005, partial [Phycisphaerales bacterium]